LKVFWSGQTS